MAATYLLELDGQIVTAIQVPLTRSMSFKELLFLAASGAFTRVRLIHLDDHRVLNDISGACLSTDAREALSNIIAAEAVRS